MPPDRVTFLAGTLGRGGAEQQLFYMATALQNRGTAVRVLSLTRGEHWEAPLRARGIPVEWVGERAGKARRLLAITRALRREPADVVQSAHFFTNLYVVAAARWRGCRDIGAIRGNAIHELATHRVLGRPSLRLPRTLAVNSRAAIDNAARYGVPRSRLHFLPNVVDTERFRPGSRRRNGTMTLLAAGRLVPGKRFDRFLSLVARLRRAPVKALLVGDGPERPVLERRAASLRLGPDRVEFRRGADLARVYGEADVFVLTSDHEGTPNVLLEAMASGLAVVSTPTGGAVDVIRDEATGFLHDGDDEAGFAERVAELVSDETLRRETGLRARAWIVANHSVQRMPDYLERLYDGVPSCR